MKAHATTSFPILQTVMTRNATTSGPSAAANAGGATLASNASGTLTNDAFRLVVPSLGHDVIMTAGGFYCYGLACGNVGNTGFELYAPDPYTSNLNWTTFGTWASYSSTAFTWGTFATGYITPAAAIPVTGTATYTGLVSGSVSTPTDVCISCISGNASMQANFGTGSMTGSLTSMMLGATPWNNVSLSGTISSGINAFSGTTAATSAPGGIWALSGSASGTFAGRFFGPSAQELGAVWTLFDGTRAATGAIGAKSGP